MPEIVQTLPPHLKDEDGGAAIPYEGKSFRPSGEWWFDPITGYTFKANGFGYFEGVVLAHGKKIDHEILAVSNMLVVREFPGVKLTKCTEPESPLDVDHLKDLLKWAWDLNRFDAGFVLGKLIRKGIQIAATNKLTDWHIELNGCDVNLSNPVYASDPSHLEILEVRRFSEKEERELKDELTGLASNPEWKLSEEDMKDAQDAADRMLKSRGLERKRIEKKRELKAMTVEERWAAVVTKAKEAGLPSGTVQDVFKRVCADLGVAAELNEKDDENLRKLEKAISLECQLAQRQNKVAAEVAETEVFGEAPSAKADTKPEAEDRDMSYQYEQLLKSVKKQGITQAMLDQWSSEAEGDSQDKFDQVQLKVADYLANLPEKVAKPKAAKTEVKAEPSEEVAPEPTGKLHGIEAEHITNHQDGTVLTFNEVMRRHFNLQCDIEAAKARLKKYTEQQEAVINELENKLNGWAFLYQAQINGVVHDQFMKQRKPDGSFKPATVKTEWATFKRQPQKDAVCIDPKRYQAWLDSIPEDERVFYGEELVIDIQVKGNKKQTMLEVAQGQKRPGWLKLDEPDEIGIPKITLSSTRGESDANEEDVA